MNDPHEIIKDYDLKNNNEKQKNNELFDDIDINHDNVKLHNDLRNIRINEINKSNLGNNTSNDMIDEITSKISSSRNEKLENFRKNYSYNYEEMKN